MKFANVDGQRREAQPGLLGECPACGSPMIAKCGEVRDEHWAHKSKCAVDRWWEPEGQWHRAWKSHFPDDWQEIIHPAENGMKHIADVKTDRGWAIEFQHSHITPEERRSRDAFYKKLVWVVDATRRKTDAARFDKALASGTSVGGNPYIRRVRSDDCRLIQEWSGGASPVFFDFGHEPTLVWLLAVGSDGPVYVGLFPRIGFIQSHLGKGPQLARDFDEFVKTYRELVTLSESFIRTEASRRAAPQTLGFQRHLARKRFRRL